MSAIACSQQLSLQKPQSALKLLRFHSPTLESSQK